MLDRTALRFKFWALFVLLAWLVVLFVGTLVVGTVRGILWALGLV